MKGDGGMEMCDESCMHPGACMHVCKCWICDT